ncbi:anaerobic ribonucleoside-triphosphate reductase [Enterobacter chengduensis]
MSKITWHIGNRRSPTEQYGFECPCCGNHSETLQVTRRVCEYLGAPNARPFIEGKQNKVISRVKHGHG